MGDQRSAARGRGGSGVLDGAAWRQKASLTVLLVNLTNPMMLKGPIGEFYAVGQQKVRLLVGGECLVSHRDGEWLEVPVLSILDHEVVAVDLG